MLLKTPSFPQFLIEFDVFCENSTLFLILQLFPLLKDLLSWLFQSLVAFLIYVWIVIYINMAKTKWVLSLLSGAWWIWEQKEPIAPLCTLKFDEFNYAKIVINMIVQKFALFQMTNIPQWFRIPNTWPSCGQQRAIQVRWYSDEGSIYENLQLESTTWIYNLNLQLESTTWICNLNLHTLVLTW